MAFDLLDTPLRLTWDLGDDNLLPDADLRQLAAKVAAGGVFFVTLQRPGVLLDPAGIMEQLASSGCQVSLVVGRQQVPVVAGLPISRVLIDAAEFIHAGCIDFSAVRASIQQWRTAGYSPDLLLVPRPDNLPLLPGLIRFCHDTTVSTLKLPNLPLAGMNLKPAPQLVGPEDVLALQQQLLRQPLADGQLPDLEIHDLFLWELLTPSADRSGYSGCQAGNSLGHLDPRGKLYPCSSWPQALGSLLDAPLYDLWQSADRFAVRKQIACLPRSCSDCAIAASCLAGCRGLGGVADSRGAGRDPMCSGKR